MSMRGLLYDDAMVSSRYTRWNDGPGGNFGSGNGGRAAENSSASSAHLATGKPPELTAAQDPRAPGSVLHGIS